jgi:hypothetical protein
MRKRYVEINETNEFERVVKEYNNHYGYNLFMSEHRSNNIDTDNITHLNIVNDDNSLKKR